jgi:hypothetical protein
VTHALWENGNPEAFLKHVMAALSYVQKKGYIKEYEEAERTAGLAVHESRVREDQYMAAPAVPAGDVQPELEAYEEAEAKVREKNFARVEVARKMFVLYENLLSENARHKWTTIVELQSRSTYVDGFKGYRTYGIKDSIVRIL